MSGQRSVSVFYSVIAWNRYESAHGWRGCRKFLRENRAFRKTMLTRGWFFAFPGDAPQGPFLSSKEAFSEAARYMIP